MAAAIVGLGLYAAANYRAIVSRVVTSLAYSDAVAISAAAETSIPPGDLDETLEGSFEPLQDAYGDTFLAGYLDRDYLLRRMAPEAVTRKALPAWVVVIAYYHLLDKERRIQRDPDAQREEALLWLDSIARLPEGKEVLVELLTSDYTALGPHTNEWAAGLPKRLWINMLFGKEDDMDSHREFCVEKLTREHWRAILHDSSHPREKVRAGSLLLLSHHPSEAVFLERARAALADASEWVRLAAASTLALHGDALGEGQLVRGTEHPRWEVRWWSAFTLARVSPERAKSPLERHKFREEDEWVRRRLRSILTAIERGERPAMDP